MNLRLVLVLFGATLLASCATCNCTCSPQTQAKLAIRFAQLAKLNFLPGGTAPTNVVICEPGKKCELDVTVNETLDPKTNTKTCTVQLNYCTLCVRGATAKSGQPAMEITWRLKMPDGSPATNYEFDENAGIQVSYAGLTGRRDFYARHRSSTSAQEFVWRAGPDATGLLPHKAHVYPVTPGSKECEPIDPDVINSN